MKIAWLVIVALLSMGMAATGADSCGLKPLKPLKPLGCKDLVAECRCNSEGKNCGWTWVCVK